MKEWMFSEADFRHLEMEDFKDIYFELRRKTIRPEDVTIALTVVIRFMKRQMKYSYISDLQIGVETN